MYHSEKKKFPTLDQSTLHTIYPDVQLMKRHLVSKLESQTRFKNDFDTLSVSRRAVLSCGPTFGIWPLSNPLGQFMVKQGDIHKTVHLHSELKTNYVFGAIMT